MFPLDTLSQLYVLSTVLGGGFIAYTFALGHFDDHGSEGGFDKGGFDKGGFAKGSDHSLMDHIDTDVDMDADIDGHADLDGHGGDNHTDKYGLLPVTDNLRDKVLRFLMSALSPMSISIFLFGFGFTGFMFKYLFPILGPISLAPAFIGGVVILNIFKSLIKLMIKYLTSSSHARQEDIVGNIAEVQVSMSGERPGEVTYILESKLFSSAAKPSKPGIQIKRGSKVIIVSADGPTVLVEPYVDESSDEFYSSRA